jgi:3'(2'), 5'-bisphosphate nucleotidase
MAHDREREVALEAARQAARHVLSAYEAFEAIPDARADISTAADREAQEIILKLIRAAFPDDALCAEEATPTLRAAAHTGPRLWVVDPIDGTRGFAQKNGEFSVMVAFVLDGQIAVGAVAEPAQGRLTYAVRGGGCWAQDGEAEPVRCRVSVTTELSEATLVQSRSRTPTRQARMLGAAHVVETHSAGVKLVRVARGEADVYVNHYPNFHDWDICAGQILVEEAGGQVTGMRGETIRYGLPGAEQRRGLIASNGALHEAVVARLAGGP